MDRRQYLAVLAPLLGAGCVLNGASDSGNDEGTENGQETTTGEDDDTAESREEPEPLPGDFQSLGGSTLWEHEPAGRLHSVAVDGRVCLATPEALTCLSPSGDVQWSVDAEKDGSSVAELHDLTVADGSVYRTARVALGTGEVAAYDVATGDRQWAQTLDVSSLRFIDVTENAVFVGMTSDDPGTFPVLALDVGTGEERWRTNAGMETAATVSHGLCLTYSVVDSLTALDAATGEIRWERSPVNDGGEMWIVGDTVCVVAGETAVGYSLPSGEKTWEQSLPATEWSTARAPPDSSHPADIYVSDWDKNLRALDATTGEEVWEMELQWEGFPNMAFDRDSLVIHHAESALASYEITDGSQRWAYSLGSDEQVSFPVIAEETVFLPLQQDGKTTSVATLDTETGDSRWRMQLADSSPVPWPHSVLDGYLVLRSNASIYGVPVTPSGAR